MAIAERYVNDNSSGLGDGTTEATSGPNAAWTWSEMLTNLAAGQRANIKGNVLRGTSPDSFTNAGTSSSPMWLRFYNSTIGDLESNGTVNGRNADGTLDTTNFPTVSCAAGTYTLTFPTYCIIEHGNFDFSASTASQAFYVGSYGTVRRVKVQVDNSSGESSYGFQYVLWDTVDVHNTAASPSVSNTACFGGNRRNDFYNCRASSDVATITGFRLLSSFGSNAFRCQSVSCDRAFITSGSLNNIIGCSARDFNDSFVYLNGSAITTITDCVAWGDGTGKFVTDNGTNSRMMKIDTNAYGNTGADTITGDYVINQNRVTLTADPFTGASDLSLNDTAGGGALCKNESIARGGQDLGAIQSAESGSGGGRRNRAKVYVG